MLESIKKYLLVFILCVYVPLHAVDPNGPFLILRNAHTHAGMFAVFTSVLGALELYEKERLSGIKVELDGLYKEPSIGPNWWEYYFEPINVGNESAASSFYTPSFEDTHHLMARGIHMERKAAHKLINKYIRIKPEIQAEVSAFANKYFGKYTIGVHHRGTDKKAEYPTVPYDITLNAVINAVINAGLPMKQIKIFVATDQADFLSFIRSIFPKNVINGPFVRSNTEASLHSSDHLYLNRYEKGKEALLDCLLLAQCDILIRPPTSCLSITSGRFNRKQPQVIVR